MKSTLFVASLFAALAVSKPLKPRYYVTVTDVYTDTMTVTGSTGFEGWGGSWRSRYSVSSSSSAAAPVAATTTTEESTSVSLTLAASSFSTPEAIPSSWSTTEAAPSPSTTTEAAPSPSTTTEAAPAPSSASSTTSSAAASSGTAGSYAQAILDQHNNHRSNASVPALTWSDDMATIAQQIAVSCVYAHNTQQGGGGYGQNIGAGATPDAVPALITNEMYNDEIGFYPLPYGQESPDMSNFESWGHYSQIVWKSTTSVGCYTEYCPNGLANVGSGVSPYFTVCNYSPPGNFAGEYGDNVLAPSAGMPTVEVPSQG